MEYLTVSDNSWLNEENEFGRSFNRSSMIVRFFANRLAPFWIEWIDDDPQCIPTWVAKAIDRDSVTAKRFEALQQLRERLHDDRDVWLRPIEHTQPLDPEAADLASTQTPVAEEKTRLKNEREPRRPTPVAGLPVLKWGLGLAALVLLSIGFWSLMSNDASRQRPQAVAYSNERLTERLPDSSEAELPQAVDWKPVFATAHAGQKVSTRITESTAELVVKSRGLARQWLVESDVRESILPAQAWSRGADVKAALRPLQLLINLD